MRGKLTGFYDIQPGDGLIPACAGKTAVESPVGGGFGAHPRVCGENGKDLASGYPSGGSSPRVRGKPHDRRTLPHMVRLIPACAGKTSGLSRSTDLTTAHPRVCGENVDRLAGLSVRRGSSPRVRGKHLFNVFYAQCRRLIPACAGKTLNDLEF